MLHTRKLPPIKPPPYNNLHYSTIPWPSYRPLSLAIQWLLPILTHSERTGLFIYIFSMLQISNSPNSRIISNISLNFQSLQSINNFFEQQHEKYTPDQVQLVRTLAYQLDQTLEVLLTICKKLIQGMENLVKEWRMGTIQQEINKVERILVEI